MNQIFPKTLKKERVYKFPFVFRQAEVNVEGEESKHK